MTDFHRIESEAKDRQHCGVATADLIAHPSRREILLEYKLIADDRDTFGNKISAILQDDTYLRSRSGQIYGYGKKLLP